MATSQFREDYLSVNLTTPASDSRDSLGRATTATADYLGRPLRRILRANTSAVTVGQELQFAGGTKYVVTVQGTTAASEPSVPSVGATVADGTATLLRQK